MDQVPLDFWSDSIWPTERGAIFGTPPIDPGGPIANESPSNDDEMINLNLNQDLFDQLWTSLSSDQVESAPLSLSEVRPNCRSEKSSSKDSANLPLSKKKTTYTSLKFLR